MKERIEQKIMQNISVEFLEVKDISQAHVGHSGWREGGETHFIITIISSDFINKGLLARHKQLYEILSSEMKSGIHALQLQLHSPEEAKTQT
jgi:BolA protein